MFLKIDVLKNFYHIHKKAGVLESLLNKFADLRACIFIKKRLQHRCFPVNIAKFLRATFFIEHLWWLLLYLLNQKFVSIKKKKDFQILKKQSKLNNINDTGFRILTYHNDCFICHDHFGISNIKFVLMSS